jgi:very-short-patch-repair endonuclease
VSKNDQYERSFAYQLLAHRLPTHVEQFRFGNSTDIRKSYRADFCFPDYWLIVEIDGGIWMPGGGAHSHPIDIERNMRKQNDALLWGYSMLRFTPKEVQNHHAIGFTQKVLFAKGWRSVGSQRSALAVQ